MFSWSLSYQFDQSILTLYDVTMDNLGRDNIIQSDLIIGNSTLGNFTLFNLTLAQGLGNLSNVVQY